MTIRDKKIVGVFSINHSGFHLTEFLRLCVRGRPVECKGVAGVGDLAIAGVGTLGQT